MFESNLLYKKPVLAGPQPDEHSILFVHPYNGAFRDFSSHAAPISNNGMSIDLTNTLFGTPTIKAATNGFLTVPNPTYLALGTADMTFESYFYITTINTVSGANVWPFFTWGNWNSGTQPYNQAMAYITGSTPWVWYYKNASTAHTRADSPAGAISRTVWHHFAFQRKSNTWQMFLDGTPLAAAAAVTDGYSYNTARDLYIGRLLGGSTGNVVWSAVGNFAYMHWSDIARYSGTFNPFAY